MLNITRGATEDQDLVELHYLIELSNKTGELIEESVIEIFKYSIPGLLLWAILYKKKPDHYVELNLIENKDSVHGILPYLAAFKDLKSGLVWDKLVSTPELSLRYAQLIERGRFIEGEVSILKSDLKSAYIDFLTSLPGNNLP